MSHSRQTRRSRSSGFTLVELLIVIVIIGILAGIAVPLYLSQRNKAKDAAVKENIHTLQVGVQSYAADNSTFPASSSLDGSLKGTYVDKWPQNPFTNTDVASGSAAGDYTYSSDGSTSYTLAGHLSSGQQFSVTGSAVQAATDFPTVSAKLIALQQAFHDAHGYWPRTWSPYQYTDLGLDPADYSSPIGNVVYKPSGSTLLVRPATGYVMTATDAQGAQRTMTTSLNWNLVYDVTTGQWYYHYIDPSNAIDISTLKITAQ